MYASKNFKTKKEFREAVERGVEVTVYQPNGGMTGAPEPTQGAVGVEGPWYPQPHRWYGTATLKDGVVVKVK
jgi:hypothetical protein